MLPGMSARTGEPPLWMEAFETVWFRSATRPPQMDRRRGGIGSVVPSLTIAQLWGHNVAAFARSRFEGTDLPVGGLPGLLAGLLAT